MIRPPSPHGWTGLLLVFLCGCVETGPDVTAVREVPGQVVVVGPAAVRGGAAERPSVGMECASEAEFLVETVTILAAPEIDTSVAATLGPGDSIYRCKSEGVWLAVMYPGADEPVDCNFRSREPFCPVGWVKGPVRTEIVG